MKAKGIQSMLVTEIENVRYLTGFTGSWGACLVTLDGALFITDGRYTLQAGREVQGIDVRIERQNESSELSGALKATSGVLGFEADHVSVSRCKKLQEAAGRDMEPTSGLVENLRRVKDSGEVALIEEAVHVVDATFGAIVPLIRAGTTERELAIEIDFTMRRFGADKEGFDTIAASGPNSAFPHHHPTNRAIQPGDFLKMDFGALRKSYNSDITRTVSVGQPSARQREIYSIVLDAQMKAIAAIRPGVKGKEIDAIAREVITAAGYGDCFNHGLGHSLGRTVHDGPGFSRTVEAELVPGMVLTVEPGIYIEGFGGVRIEDDIVVTEEGCSVLTGSSKELLSVGE